MDINIIYEDNNILVAEKPPGIASQSDKTGDDDLMAILDRNGLHLIHRLDRPVGGVIVYGKNKNAASKLSRQVSENTIIKEYLAVVCGNAEKNEVVLTDHLKKLRTINMSKVVEAETPGAKKAELSYSVISRVDSDEFEKLSLLKVRLKTGRHHQIRVQLANAGLPIWGDNKYNRVFMKKKGWTQIALWSYSLTIRHPADNRIMELKSLPDDTEPWNQFSNSIKELI
ncbi:MAG: RluA family pseudouridine synthase [Gudongella sp.]|jgi:23S rRNA pseudouridine1911/1915/1917 synthase|nr:RluA family pseudouridine synthase [Gudongella sp.]